MRIVALLGLVLELGFVLLIVLLAYGYASVDDAEPTSELAALAVGAIALAVAALTVWALYARRATSTRAAVLGVVGAAHLAGSVAAIATLGAGVAFVLTLTAAGCLLTAFKPEPAARAGR